jgi:hypothetical protein
LPPYDLPPLGIAYLLQLLYDAAMGTTADRLTLLNAGQITYFWSLVKRTSNCWLWSGTIFHGYGRIGFRIGGKDYGLRAHRVAYYLCHGNISDDLTIDHLCHNKPCVNPRHLEQINLLENVRRRPIKTHCKRGHAFDLGNTRILKNSNRECRTCMQDHQRHHRNKDRKAYNAKKRIQAQQRRIRYPLA